MKTVHIAGCAGVAGIGMTRCLKHDYEVRGHDESIWASYVSEATFDDGGGIHLADMLVPVPDPLVKKYAGHDKTFLPSKEVIELCQDKARTAKVLGGLAPKTYWVRDTHGAGGSGAQMASEYLPGRNYSVELLYKDGNLLGYFTKERLAYDLKGRKDPLWQRGSSAVSVCIRSEDLLARAMQASQLVSDEFGQNEHGIYSVDFKEDELGTPKVTEINPGRFLTASYVYFYSTDYNLPLAMVKSYFNEPYELGEYPEGTMVIRQTDCLARVVRP